MLEYLEQYSFLKGLFNYKTERVQDSAFAASIISFFTNFFLIVTGMFEKFAANVLGVGIAFMLMLFVILIVDLITGLAAAKKSKEILKSKKGLRWVFKLGSYVLFIYVINCFSEEAILQGYDWLAYPINIIKIYIVAHIAIWELQSIDENLERMGYNFRILKMINPIFRLINRAGKKKMEEAGVDADVIEDLEKLANNTDDTNTEQK